MQGVAAKNDASYDLSRARASVTGQTTIAASTATTSLPNRRIVTRGCPAPTQWRSVKSCPTSPSNPPAAAGTPSFWLPSKESALPAPAGPTDVVYRFLYLSTFRPAISVRIERRDSIRMTVRQTEGWGGLRSERPRMEANRSVAIAGLGLIGVGARGGPLLVGYCAGRTRRARRIAVDSGGRPDRPTCSSRSLEPARSRSRRGLPPGGQSYPGSRTHPARRTRLRAPSNNRMQLTGRGHRFVEGLAPPAVLRHVLAI